VIGASGLREWLNNSIAIQHFRDPVFQAETIAPDNDEASFKGTFQRDGHRQDGTKETITFQYSLRVSKDKDSGKWRVSFFQFKERPANSK
jgi:hypothetical protein